MEEYKCPVCTENNRNGILIEKNIISKDSHQEYSKFECNYFQKLEEGFEKCGFEIWRLQFGYNLKDNQLRDLFLAGETDFIEDFVSSKTRKKYTAKLILNKETSKIYMKFPDKTDENLLEDVSCPNCEGNVISINKGYMCENYIKEECGVFIPKTVSHSDLSLNDVKLLLNGEPTGLIDDFCTNDGEVFTSKLILDDTTMKVIFHNEICPCPLDNCTGTIISTKKTFRCNQNIQNDPNSCQYVFFREISGTVIEIKTFVELINNKKTIKPLNFISKKTEKPFMANLIYTSDGKVNFEFINSKK